MFLILPLKVIPTFLTPRNINRQITPEPKGRKVIGLASLILEGRIHPWTVINRDLSTASFCFPKYRSDLKLQTWESVRVFQTEDQFSRMLLTANANLRAWPVGLPRHNFQLLCQRLHQNSGAQLARETSLDSIASASLQPYRRPSVSTPPSHGELW